MVPPEDSSEQAEKRMKMAEMEKNPMINPRSTQIGNKQQNNISESNFPAHDDMKNGLRCLRTA